MAAERILRRILLIYLGQSVEPGNFASSPFGRKVLSLEDLIWVGVVLQLRVLLLISGSFD